MYKLFQTFIIASIAITFTFCGQNDRVVQVTPGQENNHKVEILEVLVSNSYSYFFVKEEFNEFWMATSISEAKVGDVLYYVDGIEMRNFPSKELDRTFDKIIFVDNVSTEPIDRVKEAHKAKKTTMGAKPNSDIKVDPAENGITVGDLYANMKDYDKKKVIVRGEVVKFNEAIMDKNWVHIQDGTESEGKFDLTITSQVKVAVGDVVTFEGIVYLNKDFGSGYLYELIIEEATIIE